MTTSDERNAAKRTIIINSGRNQSSGLSANQYNSTEWLDLTSQSEGAPDAASTEINSKKVSNLLANLPEDMRISKLLRSLSGEKDADVVKRVCEKLSSVVLDPTNGNYIRRSIDILADTILRVFKEGPAGAMRDVARVFGKMGWIIRSDFNAYRAWLQRMYKHERIRDWVMLALEHTLQLDAKHRDIRSDSCNRTIEMLKECLEDVESPTHFVAITNVIKLFAQSYPKQFQSHFADIVDIVIGWLLETDQSLDIKEHCSMILQTFKASWLNDVNFTRNLLSQFLEDVVTYREDLQKRSTDDDRKENASEICVGSIVGATNSILKCIYDSPAVLCQHIGVDLFNGLLSNVLELIETIEAPEKAHALCSQQETDLIYMNVNELIVIALDCRKFGLELADQYLLHIVQLQLRSLKADIESEEKVLIVLFVVYKLIAELKTNISIEFVEEIFATGDTAVIHQLKFSRNQKIYKSIAKIYQSVMNLKNVELLQLAYKQILEDLEAAQRSLASRESDGSSRGCKYTFSQSECIITFNITALSTLAVSNSSIIVLWALEPTILELLIDRLLTAQYDDLWIKSSETFHAVLLLLVSHCRNNSNFIASSVLLNTGVGTLCEGLEHMKIDDSKPAEAHPVSVEFVPGAASFNVPAATANASASESSPTKSHFEVILKFLSRVLLQQHLNEHHLALLLEWCDNLIKQSAQFAGILAEVPEFTEIIISINRIANRITTGVSIQLKCADCLDSLYAFESINAELHVLIAETCCVLICTTAAAVRDRYTKIFARLPLKVSLNQVNQLTGTAKVRQRQIYNIQHWHSRTPSQLRGGEMRFQYFLDFIRAIKIYDEKSAANDSDQFVESILATIFTHSWSGNSLEKVDSKEIHEFRRMAAIDIRVVTSWAQWEAAQLCTNNKLRTPLGKPQETFLKIESIIKENARVLALKDKMSVSSIDTILSNQRRARILLGFMEALEKCIYNASEGTAVALPPAEKPARTFFHLNAVTCNEWFNRIRTAVDLIALHCMEPELVIRYTSSVLKQLASSCKTSEPIFEHTLMSHAWALLRNFESDALHGLYTWTKAKAHKKFPWIKVAAGKGLLSDPTQFPPKINFPLDFRASRRAPGVSLERIQVYFGRERGE